MRTAPWRSGASVSDKPAPAIIAKDPDSSAFLARTFVERKINVIPVETVAGVENVMSRTTTLCGGCGIQHERRDRHRE